MSKQNRGGYGRQASVLASLPVLVTTHDADGTYTGMYTSLQVKSTGSPKELVGSSLSEVLNEEATERMRDAVETALETGTRRYTELPVRFAGEEFWRGVYVAPMVAPSGERSDDEVIAASFDLTRQHECRTALSEVVEAVVSSTSRSELEREFCRRLVENLGYEAAWIGGYEDGELRVRSSAGCDAYLEDITDVRGSVEETGDTGVEAARSGEPVKTPRIDEADEDWAGVAVNHGLHGAVAVPLSYGGVDYGVLAVYVGDPVHVAPWREDVLTEYADAVGYALSAVRWRNALADAGATVEIELHDETPLRALCQKTELDAVEVASVVPRSEGTIYYLDTDDGSLGYAVEQVEGVEQYTEETDEVTAVVTEDGLGEMLGDEVSELGYRVTDDSTSITATVTGSESVRSLTAAVRNAYPDASVEVDWDTDGGTDGLDVEGMLTRRQHEVLEAAYRYGYFDRDRKCDLTDLAETLGVSRWTVSEHLRAAQRKLCSEALE